MAEYTTKNNHLPWINATTWTPFSSEKSDESALNSYVKLVLLIVNGLLSVLGNLLNFVIISRLQTFKRNIKVYMYTLSLADFVTGLLVLSIWQEYQGYFCKINGFLLSLSPAISSLSILWIAIDKYCLIHYPFKYNSLFPKSAAPIIVIRYSAIATILLLWVSYTDGAFFENIHFDPMLGICLMNFQNKGKLGSIVTTALAGMGLPLVILVVLYLKMALTAHNHAKRINVVARSVQRGPSSSRDQEAMFVNEWKGFALFAVVTGTFFLAWLPFWTTNMLSLFTDVKVPAIVYITSGLLTISSSWWNPVIYAFGNKNFRENMIKLFKCTKC